MKTSHIAKYFPALLNKARLGEVLSSKHFRQVNLQIAVKDIHRNFIIAGVDVEFIAGVAL